MTSFKTLIKENTSANSDEATSVTADEAKRNLIVNYIPQFTTDEELTNLFQVIGEVENAKIIRHPFTRYSFGYGFIKYRHQDDASKAIQTYNGFRYKNKKLKVSYSRPKNETSRDSNLFISHLPRDFTEEDLINLFSKFGEIVQKNLLRDKITGYPKGVAFVRFSRADEAQAAINALNGIKLEKSTHLLSVRIAEDPNKQIRHRHYYNFIPFSDFGRNNLNIQSFRPINNLQFFPDMGGAGDFPYF